MIKVFFDGSCEPNPGGIVKYGALIIRHEETIYEISKRANIDPAVTTNNVAEYCALIAAMKYLISQNLQNEEIYFFGDSKLVINQMLRDWTIGDGKYAKYAWIAADLSLSFPNAFFEWIPREQNTRADSLSRKA